MSCLSYGVVEVLYRPVLSRDNGDITHWDEYSHSHYHILCPRCTRCYLANLLSTFEE